MQVGGIHALIRNFKQFMIFQWVGCCWKTQPPGPRQEIGTGVRRPEHGIAYGILPRKMVKNRSVAPTSMVAAVSIGRFPNLMPRCVPRNCFWSR